MFIRETGRVGANVNADGSLSDGSGQIVATSYKFIGKSVMGMPSTALVENDAAGILNKLDNRCQPNVPKTIEVAGVRDFVADMLVIASECAPFFDLLDIQVDGTSILPAANSQIPCSLLTEVAVQIPARSFEKGEVAIDKTPPLTITVRNRDTVNREFRAGLWGNQGRRT